MKFTPNVFALSLYPLFLTISYFVAQPSLRQTLLFLGSFSFQSAVLDWIFLFTANPVIGKWAARYTLFVALVWMIYLGGKETTALEWWFNLILHYFFPAITIIAYSPYRSRPVRSSVYGRIYPIVYLIFIVLLELKIGYLIYPILRDNPFFMAALWTACLIAFQ